MTDELRLHLLNLLFARNIMQYGDNTADLLVPVIDTRDDTVIRFRLSLLLKFDLSPCRLPFAFSAVTKEIRKFASIGSNQLIDRFAMRFLEIEIKKTTRRFIRHQQPVILIGHKDGIANAIDDRFNIFAPVLGQLKLKLQILDLFITFRDAPGTLIKMFMNRLA
jgi:hypothetical protein